MSSNSIKSCKWCGLLPKQQQEISDRKRGRRRSKGHFVVYAKGGKRFEVPLGYLDHPIFRVLLEVAEEEFGNIPCGPLRVPCEEQLMDRLVSFMGTTPSSSSSSCL